MTDCDLDTCDAKMHLLKLVLADRSVLMSRQAGKISDDRKFHWAKINAAAARHKMNENFRFCVFSTWRRALNVSVIFVDQFSHHFNSFFFHLSGESFERTSASH